jgi:hypothetical protein
MKIVRHDAYIAKRKRNSRLLAIVGFLLLTGTLFLALNPQYILISYIFMLGGFILFNLGMQQVGRWSRNPRNDQVLDQQLKSLPDRYTLVHYPEVGSKRLNHVLVHPGGTLVITARELSAEVEQRGPRWRTRGGGFRKLFSFSGPQLGNPSMETEQAISALEAFLAEHQFEIDVDGAVVFLHPAVELSVEDPDFPVLHADELPSFVESLPTESDLSAKEREQLVDLLRGEAVVATGPAVRRRRPVRRRST